MKKFYPGQIGEPQSGKVRDLFFLENGLIVAETTNRISAFDVILPIEIPLKGVILNIISAVCMKVTRNVIPNYLVATPHPRVSIWRGMTPFQIEVIVRGYNNINSSFYRNYTSSGKPNPWGYELSPNLKPNQKFPSPLITPTTKAPKGQHDEDISFDEIIARGLVTKEEAEYLSQGALELFKEGGKTAKELGLILVDTKYEFGKDADGKIHLIDEVHTPDSSRYWYEDSYLQCLETGNTPKELSKEFLRQWLMDNGFQGKDGGLLPKFPNNFAQEISERYLELFDQMGLNRSMLKGEAEDPYEKVCAFLTEN